MAGESIIGGLSLTGAIPFQARTALEAASPIPDLANVTGDVRRVAEDFEAFFLAQTMANMFAGIETDSVFGGGPGESAYRSFLMQEYGRLVARAGGIGITDAVAREIIKLQEAQ